MTQYNLILNRKSNFELLRIVSMLFIIAHHLSVYASAEMDSYIVYLANGNFLLLLNKLWLLVFRTIGFVGVNLFLILSGYFSVSKTKFEMKRLIKLILQCLFYSILIYLFDIFILKSEETIFQIVIFLKNCIAPFSNWWFAKTYLTMFLLTPFINALLIKLSKKEFINILLLLTFMFSIIPSFGFLFSNLDYNNIIWFIYLYSLGAYIKLHHKEENNGKNNPRKKYFYIGLLMFCILLFESIKNKLDSIAYLNSLIDISFAKLNSIFVLLLSYYIFMVFYSIELNSNRIINLISSTTFGIYLIHDHSAIRKLLWEGILNMGKYETHLFFAPITIVTCLLVFIVCSIIDFLRKQLEIKFDKQINYLSLFSQKKVNTIVDNLQFIFH